MILLLRGFMKLGSAGFDLMGEITCTGYYMRPSMTCATKGSTILEFE